MTYHYTLVNYTAKELDAEMFKQNMTPNILKQICANPSLSTILDRGGVIVFQYNGKDQKSVSTISIKESDCLNLAK